MRIFVERTIKAPLDSVWKHTQDPALHQRWDLRFTDIKYLPRPDSSKPQEFLYATRLGFGLHIEGRGETAGSQSTTGGESTSALRFWSDDKKSLIREGSGYWKYAPLDGSVRFLTAYDYEVRFGIVGVAIDRVIFRPLIGWATAWSFDRLALWLEKGISPESALAWSLVHAVARISIAFVWIYHGLIPKLIYRDAAETAMMRDMGISAERAAALLAPAGFVEILLGLILICAWRQRWPLALTGGLMALALLGVALSSPAYLTTAFNPVTLNFQMISLCVIGWIASRELPSASNCLRKESGV